MGKAINDITDFEIDPSIVDELVEVVLANKILWGVGEFDLDVLQIVKRRC